MNDSLRPLPLPGWSSINRAAPMNEAPPQRDSNEALDRALIVERVNRYGWAYDERQEALLGECFTQDGLWEGSIMGHTPVGPFVGRQAIVEFLTGFWSAQTDQRRHIFTNHVVSRISERSAEVWAYLLLTSASDEIMEPITTGPYRIQMVKDESSIWRISRLEGGWDSPFG